jgi:death-on-curing protein
VLALHAGQVERYGGHHGVRDVGLLESAISMPQATFSNYLRAGLMAALVFLGLNGLDLEADADSLTDLVLGVAAGKVSKADTTVFIERIREHAER